MEGGVERFCKLVLIVCVFVSKMFVLLAGDLVLSDSVLVDEVVE